MLRLALAQDCNFVSTFSIKRLSFDNERLHLFLKFRKPELVAKQFQKSNILIRNVNLPPVQRVEKDFEFRSGDIRSNCVRLREELRLALEQFTFRKEALSSDLKGFALNHQRARRPARHRR
jgi:hypothetical protein